MEGHNCIAGGRVTGLDKVLTYLCSQSFNVSKYGYYILRMNLSSPSPTLPVINIFLIQVVMNLFYSNP
jgi:hypothetical protein